MAAGVICQRMVVATGTGVVKAHFWSGLKSYGSPLELTKS